MNDDMRRNATNLVTNDRAAAEELYGLLGMELYGETHYQEWLAKQAFPDNVRPIRPVNPLGLPPCEEDADEWLVNNDGRDPLGQD